MADFAENLRKIRKSKKLTQAQLGEAINSSRRSIENYELRERKPEFDMLIALADYFDVSIDYLVGRSDDPTRL